MKTPPFNVRTGLPAAMAVCFCALIFPSCITFEDVDQFIEQMQAEKAMPAATVQRDFPEISNSGVLRMITRYGPDTYFLNRGMDAGFEFELLHAFAREHNLLLEVEIMSQDDDPITILKSGQGDVIAMGLAASPHRTNGAIFTHPYLLTDRFLVYSPHLEEQPDSLAALAEEGIPITVLSGSDAAYHLEKIRGNGISLNLDPLSGNADQDMIYRMLADGRALAAVSNSYSFQKAAGLHPGLSRGPVIAESDSIAWAVRPNAPELEQELSRYLQKHFRISDTGEAGYSSAFLNILKRHYFEESPQLSAYYDTTTAAIERGMLFSPYSGLVQSAADSIGIDPLLLTAVIAQESSFNPGSKSFAGAVGLMQILPRYSENDYPTLYDPETNIREGAAILKSHLNHYAYLDSLDQVKFALATYNAGIGHLVDARRLVMEQNRNPNDWPSTANALLMLMERRHFERAEHGYVRGRETVQYVDRVISRYNRYRSVMALSAQ
ncbi:transglycosylase SLT domain-containing protein [Rhodohalobacter mucosus]|uniref:Lytic transglycosylase F n=1 Tax=Rhodohalobacter mucosus TaxID=2079485 RepID=A0A316TV71_9BACT|nr:transglycosylase SLT domain-containing protein [Rhodohalobacter mucosus]PWN06312.1 lytic transglycosylase F [Rhodohalobacter mucosus]